MKRKIYYGLGALLFFLAALMIINAFFFRRDTISALVTRSARWADVSLDFDLSDMVVIGERVKTASFYALERVAYAEGTDFLPDGWVGKPSTPVSALSAAVRVAERALGVEFASGEAGPSLYVRLFGETDGIKDCASHAYVSFDDFGTARVTGAVYRYERLRGVSVLSYRDVMPLLAEPCGLVKLSRCELVYVMADSILQPAWLFRGAYGDGAAFEEFVRAADY